MAKSTRKRARFDQRGGGKYYQNVGPESVVSKEQRTSRERPLFQRPSPKKDHDRRRNRPKDREPPQNYPSSGSIIPSHLRKRPQSPNGRPVPPVNNSCFWCSTPFDTRLNNERHLQNCPSRTQNTKSCRGCHQDFRVKSTPPFLSEEYVRHICGCKYLRCRKCDVNNHHDVMVCPRSKCAKRNGNNRGCKVGHITGFCDYDDRISGWLGGRRDQH